MDIDPLVGLYENINPTETNQPWSFPVSLWPIIPMINISIFVPDVLTYVNLDYFCNALRRKKLTWNIYYKHTHQVAMPVHSKLKYFIVCVCEYILIFPTLQVC